MTTIFGRRTLTAEQLVYEAVRGRFQRSAIMQTYQFRLRGDIHGNILCCEAQWYRFYVPGEVALRISNGYSKAKLIVKEVLLAYFGGRILHRMAIKKAKASLLEGARIGLFLGK